MGTVVEVFLRLYSTCDQPGANGFHSPAAVGLLQQVIFVVVVVMVVVVVVVVPIITVQSFTRILFQFFFLGRFDIVPLSSFALVLLVVSLSTMFSGRFAISFVHF